MTDEIQKNEIFPPGYQPEYKDLILRMIEVGVPEKIIPYILGTEEQYSLVQWENISPKLRILFSEARENALDKVEVALLRLALGGKLSEYKRDAEGEVVVDKIKEIAPNLGAIQYLLENHRSEVWKNKKEIQLNVGASKEHTEDEINRVKQFAGGLIELCPDEASRECEVPDEALPAASGEQAGQGGLLDSAEYSATGDAAGVQDDPVDVQSEGTQGQEESPIRDVADSGPDTDGTVRGDNNGK